MGAFYELHLVYGLAMAYNFPNRQDKADKKVLFFSEEKDLNSNLKKQIASMNENAKKQYKYFFRLLRDEGNYYNLIKLLNEKGKEISMTSK